MPETYDHTAVRAWLRAQADGTDDRHRRSAFLNADGEFVGTTRLQKHVRDDGTEEWAPHSTRDQDQERIDRTPGADLVRAWRDRTRADQQRGHNPEYNGVALKVADEILGHLGVSD